MTTTTTTPCPAWCTLPTGHEPDGTDVLGYETRGHQGPRFGAISVCGEETSETPGTVILTAVSDLPEDLTADALRQLGVDAVAAADWIETHQ